MADKSKITVNSNNHSIIEPVSQKRSRTLQKKFKNTDSNEESQKLVKGGPKKQMSSNLNIEYGNSLNEKRKSERYLSSHIGQDTSKQKVNGSSKPSMIPISDQFQSLNYNKQFQTMNNLVGNNSKNQQQPNDIQNISIVGHRNLIANQFQNRQQPLQNTQIQGGQVNLQQQKTISQYGMTSSAYTDQLANAATNVARIGQIGGHSGQPGAGYNILQQDQNQNNQFFNQNMVNNQRRVINNMINEKQRFNNQNAQKVGSYASQGPSSLSVNRGNTPQLAQQQIPNQGSVYQTYHSGPGSQTVNQRGVSQNTHPHVQLLDVDSIVKHMKQQQQQQQQMQISQGQSKQPQKLSQPQKYGQSASTAIQISGFSDYTNQSNKNHQGAQNQQHPSFLSPAQSINTHTSNTAPSTKTNFKGGLAVNTNRIGTAGNSVVNSNGHQSILNKSLSNKQSQKKIQQFKSNTNYQNPAQDTGQIENMQLYVNHFGKQQTPDRIMQGVMEKKEYEIENYTQMINNNKQLRDELANNPMMNYMIKSNQINQSQDPNQFKTTHPQIFQGETSILQKNITNTQQITPTKVGQYYGQKIPNTDDQYKIKTQAFSPNVNQKVATVRNSKAQQFDEFILGNQQENGNSPNSSSKIHHQTHNNAELGSKIQKAYDNMVINQNKSMQGGEPNISQSFSRDNGYMRWNTDQKIQIQIENKQDGSPTQRTIYIKKSQTNLGSNHQFKNQHPHTESNPTSPLQPQQNNSISQNITQHMQSKNNLIVDENNHLEVNKANFISQRKAQSTDFQGVSQSKDKFSVYGHNLTDSNANGVNVKKQFVQSVNTTNSSYDKNKEYQKYLMQYINTQNGLANQQQPNQMEFDPRIFQNSDQNQNIMQMQQYLMSQTQQQPPGPEQSMGPQSIFNRNMHRLGNEGPGGMMIATNGQNQTNSSQINSSQPRSKSSIPKKLSLVNNNSSGNNWMPAQMQSSPRVQKQEPIFINHGDINININFNNSGNQNEHLNNLPNLSKEELSQLIYQNMFMQQHQQQFQQNSSDQKSQASINEQIENFAMSQLNNQYDTNYTGSVQMNQSDSSQQYPLVSKHKQRLNLAKNFQPSPKLPKSPKNQKRRLATSDTEKIEQPKYTTAQQQTASQELIEKISKNQMIGKHLKSKKQSKSSVQPSLQPQSTFMIDHQQHPLNLINQQPQKLSTSMSKQQLKKQVVQYYWQHLIQSYGMEAKVKLDVKGKTINGNQNPQQPAGSNVPFMIQGFTGKTNQPAANPSYQMGQSSSKKSIHLSNQKEQLMQQQNQILQGLVNANQKIPIPQHIHNQMNQQQDLLNHPQNCTCYHHQNETLRNKIQMNEQQILLSQIQCRKPGGVQQRCAIHHGPQQQQNSKMDVISHYQNQQGCCCGSLQQGVPGGILPKQQEQLINQRDQILNDIYQNVSQGWGPNGPPVQPQNGSGVSNLWPAHYNQFFNQYDKNDERRQNTHMMSQNYPSYWQGQSQEYGQQVSSSQQYQSSYVHLFDQFGQHSHLCKCYKHLSQRDVGSRMMMDPYQRLNYIQQVGMQERCAAQAHEAQKTKIPNTTSKNEVIPKTKRKVTVVVTRMDTINNFIKKLNQLIQITLKATDSINPLALGQIKKLGQEIGIKWQNYLDAKFIKSKDFVTFLKSKIYVLLNNLLMRNNLTLFDQVQIMCDQNDKLNQKKDHSSKKDREKSYEGNRFEPPKNSNNEPIIIGEVLKQSWLNQVQIYNLLKFKNHGFKFWVEYPTTYGNNFIVVKNVTKRRTWLTWVDYDPYEERDDKLLAIQPIDHNTNSVPAIKQDDHQTPVKKGQRSNKKKEIKVEEDPEESEDEKNVNPYGPIFPNIIYTQVRRVKIVKDLMPHQMYNHIDGINQVATKCQLHRNMKEYAINVTQEDPWSIMPETYIIELPEKSKQVLEHDEFKEFLKSHTKDSWWIIKPGEDANRGNGIKVFNNLQKIKEHISCEFNSGTKQYKTCIIQKYIENPYLIHRRKFDIRVFAMLTYISNFDKSEGILRGWYYEEGYVRTSSKEFGLAQGDNLLIHLTNDAIQKNSCEYGKYEAGNKISYSDFDKLLIKEKDVSFNQKILPQIKKRTGDVFKAAGKKLIGEVRSDYNGFEWLGLDFMIDDDMNLQLIEVNTNPCLETQSCILLQRLIPQMIDQSLKIAVDPFFGANEHQYLMNQEFVATEVKYSMVYEEVIEGIKSTPTWDMSQIYYQPPKKEQEDEEEEVNAEVNTADQIVGVTEGVQPKQTNEEQK